MKGTEAYQELIPLFGDMPVVHANGYICRGSFELADREANFYMIGSMGLASSIGLGVALCQPEKKVVVLDGDGNVLMAMGTLAMIASSAPKNLVHVVMDNQVYESTGKQKTISQSIPLEEVAKSCGYKKTMKVDSRDQVQPAFQQLLDSEGPSFLLIKVDPDFDKATGRVTHSPEEIKKRFMRALGTEDTVGA